MSLEKEFVPHQESLELKELGFDEPCFASYNPFGSRQLSCSGIYTYGNCIAAPLYQQAINFLYICSNKQIDIELKGSDTHEERIRKIEKGCKDLWNLQNNKSN